MMLQEWEQLVHWHEQIADSLSDPHVTYPYSPKAAAYHERPPKPSSTHLEQI